MTFYGKTSYESDSSSNTEDELLEEANEEMTGTKNNKALCYQSQLHGTSIVKVTPLTYSVATKQQFPFLPKNATLVSKPT